MFFIFLILSIPSFVFTIRAAMESHHEVIDFDTVLLATTIGALERNYHTCNNTVLENVFIDPEDVS